MEVSFLVWAAVPEWEQCSLTLNTSYFADLLLLSLFPSLFLCVSGVSFLSWSSCFSKASPSHTCEHPLAMESAIVHFTHK